MSVKSKGTIFGYMNGETKVPLGSVKSIKPGKTKVPPIDSTTLEDDAARKIRGLPEEDDWEIVLQYDATQEAALRALLDPADDALTDFYMTKPDSSETEMTGFLAEIGDESIENGGIITSAIKVAVDGISEFTAPAPEA